MLKLLFHIYKNILNKNERKKSQLFIIFNIIFSIFELVSVAAVLPIIFLTIGSNSNNLNLILPDYLKSMISEKFIFEDIFTYISLMIFAFFFIKYIFSIYLNLFNVKFITLTTASVRLRFMKIFTEKKYVDLINYNSSKITNLLTKVSEMTITNYFVSFLFIIRSLFIIIPLIIFLFFVNFKLTSFLLIISTFLLCAYFFIIKKYILNLGKREVKYFEAMLAIIKEFFNGHSLIKLYNLEKNLLSNFKNQIFNYARVKVIFRLINQFPKLSFEISVVTFIFLQIIILKYFDYTIEYIVSFIGVFILVSLKLVPQIIYLFSLINTIKNSQIATEILIKEFGKKNRVIPSEIRNIDYNNQIKLDEISFGYNNNEFILNKVKLNLNFGEKIGILGKSGAGKTSLINLICGFLKPSQGKILIDEKILNEENNLSWQKKISLVEQNVYLFNDTIKNNIILNNDDDKIDYNLLNQSIKKAQLSSFIEKQENGIETVINQNSSNISGGERQRIGLARALYKNSPVIILDEPTSSLDRENSNSIMEVLNSIKNKTIIIISHDEDALNICDKKYLLENKMLKERN